MVVRRGKIKRVEVHGVWDARGLPDSAVIVLQMLTT